MEDQQSDNASGSAAQQSYAAVLLHGTTSTLHKASAAAVSSIHHLPHLTAFGRSRSCSRSSNRSSIDATGSSSKIGAVSEVSVPDTTNRTASGKSATAKSMVAVSDEHADAEAEKEVSAFPAVALQDVVSPTSSEQDASSAASPPKPSYYEVLEKKRARGRSLMDAASLLP